MATVELDDESYDYLVTVLESGVSQAKHLSPSRMKDHIDKLENIILQLKGGRNG